MKKKFILFYPWLLKSPGERERETGLWSIYHTLILFSLKGTIMKKKFILFYPWLLKSPGERERERKS